MPEVLFVLVMLAKSECRSYKVEIVAHHQWQTEATDLSSASGSWKSNLIDVEKEEFAFLGISEKFMKTLDEGDEPFGPSSTCFQDF